MARAMPPRPYAGWRADGTERGILMMNVATIGVPGVAGETEASRVRNLHALEKKLLWLSSWMIHNANHVRPNRDGLKVGGHNLERTHNAWARPRWSIITSDLDNDKLPSHEVHARPFTRSNVFRPNVPARSTESLFRVRRRYNPFLEFVSTEPTR